MGTAHGTNPKTRRWGRAQRVSDSAASSTDTLKPALSDLDAQTSAHGKSRRLTRYVFDMETGDPDDVLTLLFLCSRPDVELLAVTITPGSDEQVALVRWILQHMGLKHVRLGAQDWPANSSKPVNLTTAFYKS